MVAGTYSNLDIIDLSRLRRINQGTSLTAAALDANPPKKYPRTKNHLYYPDEVGPNPFEEIEDTDMRYKIPPTGQLPANPKYIVDLSSLKN